jgi:hypothetical protein
VRSAACSSGRGIRRAGYCALHQARLQRQRLNVRIGERDTLINEIGAWKRQRNASGARIKRMFTIKRVRRKLGKYYPELANES